MSDQKNILVLKNKPTRKDFQEYVNQLEKERGFIKQNVLQKCLLLGEEIGELFKAIRKMEAISIDRQNEISREIRISFFVSKDMFVIISILTYSVIMSIIISKKYYNEVYDVVEQTGLEPVTSWLPAKCSPS